MRRRDVLRAASSTGFAGGLLYRLSESNRAREDISAENAESIPETDRTNRRLVNGTYHLTYTWFDYRERPWEFQHRLDQETYEATQRQPRGMFLSFDRARSSPYGGEIGRDILARATSSAVTGVESLTPAERLELVVSFTQSIEYARDEESTGSYDYHRTIEETLVDGVADCKDATYLLAGMLSNPPFDYRTAMVISDSDSAVGHMYLGVHRDDLPEPYQSAKTVPGGTYVPIESVSSMPVGEREDFAVLTVYDGGFHYIDIGSILRVLYESVL